MKPTFVVQNQIWQEHGYDQFVKALESVALVYTVDIIPFTNYIELDLDEPPLTVFGSGRMVDIARAEKNWHTFESFPPTRFDLIDKDQWVNGDGWETTLEALENEKGIRLKDIHIKPYQEKLFTGTVINSNGPILKQIQCVYGSYDQMDENTQRIWAAPATNLKQENRFVVIGGKIITGSVYKMSGRGMYGRLLPNDDEWLAAEYLCSGLPDDFCGALDTTVVSNHTKIVEMNNLNSAGVYASDYDAIARALVNFLT